MDRVEAVAVLGRLSHGLEGDAGASRLLERIAAHDGAEMLRDLLTEMGARAVLDGREAPERHTLTGYSELEGHAIEQRLRADRGSIEVQRIAPATEVTR